ncbi:hypothetical protein NIG5292_02882 [Nereida ignava]|uniref:Uncharacterized protein n=1 Tax=Nereida ignava TaxID=282199 RepID=A0A0U1NQU3_9RHOB|nr:hypothetical protein NIG5292_02882 [Nereida ignava]
MLERDYAPTIVLQQSVRFWYAKRRTTSVAEDYPTVFYVFLAVQAQLRRADFRCLFNRSRSITNTFSLLLHI